MEKEESIRTYLDDIKFQIVRENNKRTAFYNSDFQIVAKNKQAIRDIEKHEKLVSSEFRRQQAALESKLQKLQMTKKGLGLTEEHPRAQNFNRRRYSAPSASTLFMTTQETTLVSRGQSSAISRDQAFESLRKPDSRKKISEPVWGKDNSAESYRETRCLKDARHSIPDVKESQGIPGVFSEDNGDALHQRFHANTSCTRRRATIAGGPTFKDSLPSEGLLNKLENIKGRSAKIEEET